MADLETTTGADDLIEDASTETAPSIDTTLNEIWERGEQSRAAERAGRDADPAGADQASGRDANGRFVAKPINQTAGKTATETQGADNAAAATAQQPEPKTAAAEAQGQTLQAPADWSAEQKAQFDKVPTEGRALVLEAYKSLQADYGRKTQQIAGERKRYETLNPVLAPIDAEARKFGVPLDAAVKGMWAVHTLMVDPATRIQAFRKLVDDYDVDLTAVQNAKALPHTEIQQPSTAAIPPEFAARLSTVESELETNRRQGREDIARRDTASADAWINEKDDKGLPKRPHIEAVGEAMKAFILPFRQQQPAAPFADILQRAYDAACASDTTIRQKMIDDAATAKASQTINQDRERGTRAAAASSATVSRTGGVRAKPSASNDIDTKLNEIWERAHGGTA